MKLHVTAEEDVVAALGAAADGIVVTELAHVAGVHQTTLASFRRRGLLLNVGRGVDRLRDHPVTWRSECRAALALAGSGSALGLRTAGRLQSFYAYRDRTSIEVLTRRGHDHDTPLGRVIQTRWLPPEHVTVVDGLPCTTV